MNFAPSRGKRYSADGDGLIHEVDPENVAPLVKAGCTAIVDAAQ
jgi:hypothetical protein